MSDVVDLMAFNKAMDDVMQVSRKSLAQQCNQRAMNFSRRMLETMPPTDVQGARKSVKRYMDEQLSQRVKMVETEHSVEGIRRVTVHFRKRGKKADQLTRKNLIAQARNKKAGKKGLYGAAMRKASGELSRIAQISQGFLKSVFIPVIMGLYGVVKYRPPASLTRYISRWEGSAGFGKIKVASKGVNPVAIINLGVKTKPGQESKVQAIYQHYAQAAVDAETAEMKAHYERQLVKELGLG